MANPLNAISEQQIDRLIGSLSSLKDGDMAVDQLVACGKSAIPRLANFLLNGPPRTISLPRCRAVRVLGDLGATSTLIAYFKNYERPHDSAVLFAEDAVRSAAARELVRFPSSEVFYVLLDAARQRVTGGLVQALSEFHRPETVPLFFEILEDDLCREDAMNSLRKLPDSVRQFGILTIRGLTGITLDGPSAIYRRRATIQLLSEVGVAKSDWPDVRKFLSIHDPATVIPAARIGFAVASENEWPEIAAALFSSASGFNSLQEIDAEDLLDSHSAVVHEVALQIARKKQSSGEKPNWMSPFWRILKHELDRKPEPMPGRPA